MATTFNIDRSIPTKPKLTHFVESRQNYSITVVKLGEDSWQGLIESKKRTQIEWTNDLPLSVVELVAQLQGACLDDGIPVSRDFFRDLKGKMLAF